MPALLTVVLILVAVFAGYAGGLLHAEIGYRVGFRYGYRQGYFDGDRASWTRRRRDLQAAFSAALSAAREQAPREGVPLVGPDELRVPSR